MAFITTSSSALILWTYLRSRSISGLIPLLAVASFDVETVQRLPSLDVKQTLAWLSGAFAAHLVGAASGELE